MAAEAEAQVEAEHYLWKRDKHDDAGITVLMSGMQLAQDKSFEFFYAAEYKRKRLYLSTPPTDNSDSTSTRATNVNVSCAQMRKMLASMSVGQHNFTQEFIERIQRDLSCLPIQQPPNVPEEWANESDLQNIAWVNVFHCVNAFYKVRQWPRRPGLAAGHKGKNPHGNWASRLVASVQW